jgi:hypothetical protein
MKTRTRLLPFTVGIALSVVAASPVRLQGGDDPNLPAEIFKFSKSQFHVTLSERSLRAKSLGVNCGRFFVGRRALAPQNDKFVIY